MATSKHFLEQVKTGNVAAALQAALDNAGSLKIVTRIVGDGAGSEDVDALPDSQKICTYIDAVAGTIETNVGSQFVGEGANQALCEGHMQQVVAGCSSIRDNLDTLQALLDWVSQEQGSTAQAQPAGWQADAELDPAAESLVEPKAETGNDAAVGVAAGLGAGMVGVAAVATMDDLDFSDGGAESGLEALDDTGAIAFDGPSTAADELGDRSEDFASDSLDLDGDMLGEDSLALDSGEIPADDSSSEGFVDEFGLASALDLEDNLDLDLPGVASGEEDAGPPTEFLTAEAGENTAFFAEEGDNGEALDELTLGEMDLDGSTGEDPLAGLDLGDDLESSLGGTPLPGEDGIALGEEAVSPFVDIDSPEMTAEPPAVADQAMEDTLTGVSWAESGSGDSELDLGMLDLETEAADGYADPEVDALALDAIDDFDSGLWDEASAETVELQGEQPAKVSRSLESLFSADEAADAGAEEANSGSADPLSALFSDTSLDELDDLDTDLAAAAEDSQENLAANPFEIGDLENDPFADLMLEDNTNS